MRYTVPALLFVLCVPMLHAQDLPDSETVLAAVKANWERIEDYEVQMEMSVDIPGFRMPRRNVHYLYKAPDKVKVDVQGFAVVPKEGIQPFARFFDHDMDLEVTNAVESDGKMLYEVVFRDTFATQEARITLLVDLENGTVPRGTANVDSVDFFRTVTRYEEVEPNIWLPVRSEIQLTLPPDFKRMQQFGKMPTEVRDLDAQIKANPEDIRGFITLIFKKYKVNRGIPDWVFEEEEEGYE